MDPFLLEYELFIAPFNECEVVPIFKQAKIVMNLRDSGIISDTQIEHGVNEDESADSRRGISLRVLECLDFWK